MIYDIGAYLLAKILRENPRHSWKKPLVEACITFLRVRARGYRVAHAVTACAFLTAYLHAFGGPRSSMRENVTLTRAPGATHCVFTTPVLVFRCMYSCQFAAHGTPGLEMSHILRAHGVAHHAFRQKYLEKILGIPEKNLRLRHVSPF